MIDWEAFMFPIITLMSWSILYRHTPLWDIVEHAIVGLSLALTLKFMLDFIRGNLIIPISNGSLYPAIIGLTLGLITWLRFSDKTRDFSYWSFAIMTGIGTAICAIGAAGPQILAQLRVASWIAGTPMTNFNNFIMWLSTVGTIAYFIFTFKPGGITGTFFKGLNGLAYVGRIFMMLAFGTTLGSLIAEMAIMGITGYAYYYVRPPGSYILAIGIILLVYDVYRRRETFVYRPE
jgi:hypothetical protein